MMGRYHYILGAAVLVAAAGWLSGGVARVDGNAEFSGWRTPPSLPFEPERVAAAAGIVEQSGIFRARGEALQPAEAEAGAGEGEELENAGPPDFPEIVAASRLDGETVITMRASDGSLVTVPAGAEVEGGWRISHADLQGVEAEAEGVTTSRSLFPRPEEAEEDSTDDADNDADQ